MDVVSILSGCQYSEVADQRVLFVMYSLIAAVLSKSGVLGRNATAVNKTAFAFVQLTFSFRRVVASQEHYQLAARAMAR